jgi:hypothetical protein
VTQHGLRSRDATKNQTSNWEEQSFNESGILKRMLADAVVIDHFLQQARVTHFLLPKTHTELVIALVIEEEENHGAESYQTTPAGNFQSKFENTRYQDGRVNEAMDSRANQDDVKMCRQEVGFEESMEQVK